MTDPGNAAVMIMLHTMMCAQRCEHEEVQHIVGQMHMPLNQQGGRLQSFEHDMHSRHLAIESRFTTRGMLMNKFEALEHKTEQASTRTQNSNTDDFIVLLGDMGRHRLAHKMKIPRCVVSTSPPPPRQETRAIASPKRHKGILFRCW